jgi:hypothetical protein
MWTPPRQTFPWSVLWMLPLLLIAALCGTLTACASPTRTPVTSGAVACMAFKPITFDRLKDTDETIREVKDYNAAWTALCAAGISSTGAR